ncbi:neutral ceramidase-like, partial [Centroberyx gerrardi]
DRVSQLPVGPPPPFFKDSLLFNLLPAAAADRKPANSSFGDVLQQVQPAYRARDKTFVAVEIYHNRTATWEVVYTDASWETRVRTGGSNATVDWFIPLTAPTGSYRIKHYGHYKQMKGLRPVITPYNGTSHVFTVTPNYYY